MANQTRVLRHSAGRGFLQAELDWEYIRKIKNDYPMAELSRLNMK